MNDLPCSTNDKANFVIDEIDIDSVEDPVILIPLKIASEIIRPSKF
jgi:hypothetical protein